MRSCGSSALHSLSWDASFQPWVVETVCHYLCTFVLGIIPSLFSCFLLLQCTYTMVQTVVWKSSVSQVTSSHLSVLERWPPPIFSMGHIAPCSVPSSDGSSLCPLALVVGRGPSLVLTFNLSFPCLSRLVFCAWYPISEVMISPTNVSSWLLAVALPISTCNTNFCLRMFEHWASSCFFVSLDVGFGSIHWSHIRCTYPILLRSLEHSNCSLFSSLAQEWKYTYWYTGPFLISHASHTTIKQLADYLVNEK